MFAAAIAAMDFKLIHVGDCRGLAAILAAILLIGFDNAAAAIVLTPALWMIDLHGDLAGDAGRSAARDRTRPTTMFDTAPRPAV
ncbi:MAG: hypothetical protein WBV61_07050 [Rhodanobacteraceae bacterium]